MFGETIQLPDGEVQRLAPWQGRPGWRGWALEAFRDFDFMALPWLDLTGAGMGDDDARCVKISRSRHVLRVGNPVPFGAREARPVYVKRYLINTPRRRLGNLLSGGKARREFRLGHELIARGLRTPLPLAYVVGHPGRILRGTADQGFVPAASFLLTLELTNQGSVREWAEDGRTNQWPLFYPSLTQFMALMHARGVYHDDFSAKNACVAEGADFSDQGGPEAALDRFAIYDVDHGRSYRGRPVPTRLRMVNLYQMIHSLDDSDMASMSRRRQFVVQYLAASGMRPARDLGPVLRKLNRIGRRKTGRDLFSL